MIEYYEYHQVPVFIRTNADNSVEAFKFVHETGLFKEISNIIIVELQTDHWNVRKLSLDKFIQAVEKRRGRTLKGTGTVYDLYAVTNAIEEQAKAEKRWLTDEEGKIVQGLRRRTYDLFEAMHS